MIAFLENIKSNFYRFFLSLETLFKVFLLSKSNTVSKVSGNKPLWILANGPSLRKNIKYFLNTNMDIAVVNYFADYDVYESVKPKVYFLQAPEFWLKDVDISYINNRAKLFNNIGTKTKWELLIYIPLKAKRHAHQFQQLIDNSFITIHYYNDTPIEGFQRLRYYYYDRQLGMPRPHNILIPCLMLGMNMGYKELMLLGADHSWLPELSVDKNNNALLSQKHFYDVNASPETMKKQGKGQRKLHEILHKFYLTFQGYFEIKNYSTSKEATIYNLTEASFIDAFERKELSTALQSIA